jgi:hypothetical protein
MLHPILQLWRQQLRPVRRHYALANEMTADNWLFILVMGIIILTTYLIATAPKTTAQERKEMEEEWWG